MGTFVTEKQTSPFHDRHLSQNLSKVMSNILEFEMKYIFIGNPVLVLTRIRCSVIFWLLRACLLFSIVSESFSDDMQVTSAAISFEATTPLQG